jgi:tripeptide aminopeptidase
MYVSKGAVAAFALLASAGLAHAQAPTNSDARVKAMTGGAPFKAAVAQLDRDADRIVADTIKLTEIPAPPFKEKVRGEAYMAMLKTHGLTDVEMDPEGNVMGLRRGTGPAGGPVVIIAAHLDTVFPEGTPIKVTRTGDHYAAPGIADDTHSLAVLLGYVRALDAGKIATRYDILFVGNVGEEGPGDLRGVRYIFGKGKYKDRIRAFFSMDGTSPEGLTYGAVGSKRYRVTFKGPGGHSYGAFGIVNPMAAMGKFIADFNEVQVPKSPKTTYATSVVGGGTSVNSIPDDAWVEVDMRSESREELDKIDARFKALVPIAVAHENAARDNRVGSVTAEIKAIGDRPTGATKTDSEIVLTTAAAIRAIGYEPRLSISSTDANIPISLGLPAVTIGSGGKAGRGHSVDEWIELPKAETVRGMSAGLAALVAMANP